MNEVNDGNYITVQGIRALPLAGGRALFKSLVRAVRPSVFMRILRSSIRILHVQALASIENARTRPPDLLPGQHTTQVVCV